MKVTEYSKEKFKERLKSIISKKIDTTMIYPLSQFEALFGELWGNQKDEELLTEQQKDYRIKWQKCRNNILNNGNRNKRNAQIEIDGHDIVLKGHTTNFVVNGNIK